jgi:hypothetical protein
VASFGTPPPSGTGSSRLEKDKARVAWRQCADRVSHDRLHEVQCRPPAPQLEHGTAPEAEASTAVVVVGLAETAESAGAVSLASQQAD